MDPKIGLYIFGYEEISDKIDMETIKEFVKELPNVEVVAEHKRACNKDGAESIEEDIKAGKVDRVVLVGCSSKTYRELVKKIAEDTELNRRLFEHVNIREQCALVHKDEEKATEKAKDLVKMGVAKARLLTPLEDEKITVKPASLVIGGGVAGMQAALDLGNQGFKTYLVEREQELGGRAYSLSMTYPTTNCGICCIHDCKNCILTPKTDEVYLNDNIEVITSSEVAEVTGNVGDYKVKIKDKDESIREIEVGAIIVATGSKTFDPNKIPVYGYECEDVVTSLDLEEMITSQRKTGGKLLRPSDGKVPKTISFIQCVGSRDINQGNPYCSLVCCTYAIGQAMELKKMYPDSNVIIHYIDLRGPYRGFEEFYKEAQEMGVIFVRGRVSSVEKVGDKLLVRAEDTIDGDPTEVRADMVVLSVGQEPNDGTESLSKMLHKPLDIDNFFKELNLQFLPEDRTGIFIAGCAQGPRGIRYSIADGKVAAEYAANLMREGASVVDTIAIVNEDVCGGCRTCEVVCPYDAINMRKEDEGKLISEVITAACRGCGICGSTCPAGAISMVQFTDEQIFAQIGALAGEV